MPLVMDKSKSKRGASVSKELALFNSIRLWRDEAHILLQKKYLDTSYQNISQSFRNITVIHVLSGHSKIDKPKVLKTADNLVQVESAECRNF